MRLALISLAMEQEVGTGPLGFLPLFDRRIIDIQVAQSVRMGAEKIIVLSPTMHGSVLQYVDQLKHKGLAAEIVRRSKDLAAYAAPADDLVYLGDGIIPDEAIVERLRQATKEQIFVVANGPDYDGFERIDLNHRWLGIALLRAARLIELADVPDDWDTGSALLRTAVQSDCHRQIIADPQMEAGAVAQLHGPVDIAVHTDRRLDQYQPIEPNFLDRYVGWPLMRKALPRLWKQDGIDRYLGWFGLAVATIALPLSYLANPAWMLAVLTVSGLLMQMRNRITILQTDARKADHWHDSVRFLTAVALTVAVVRLSPAPLLMPNLVILFLLLGSFWLARSAAMHPLSGLFRPTKLMVLLILLLAATAGYFAWGLYGVAILCMIYALVAQRAKQSQRPNGDPGK